MNETPLTPFRQAIAATYESRSLRKRGQRNVVPRTSKLRSLDTDSLALIEDEKVVAEQDQDPEISDLQDCSKSIVTTTSVLLLGICLFIAASAVYYTQYFTSAPPEFSRVKSPLNATKEVLLSNITSPVTTIPDVKTEEYERFADYALITNGGRVVESQTSPSYVPHEHDRFGMHADIEERRNTPNLVIYPSSSDPYANRCWKMKGTSGKITIKLAYPVIPTNFTLEHIPPNLAIYRDISPAPAFVEVVDVTDKRNLTLGVYNYDAARGGPQRIIAERFSSEPADLIQLIIHTNHGNPNFTCIFKFRVHGKSRNQ